MALSASLERAFNTPSRIASDVTKPSAALPFGASVRILCVQLIVDLFEMVCLECPSTSEEFLVCPGFVVICVAECGEFNGAEVVGCLCEASILIAEAFILGRYLRSRPLSSKNTLTVPGTSISRTETPGRQFGRASYPRRFITSKEPSARCCSRRT